MFDNYPDREFPTHVVGTLANFFRGGAGPTHTRLNSAIEFSGIVETPSTFSRSKEDRIRDAFNQGSNAQKYLLATELVTLLREYGSFDGDAVATERAQVAFGRAGASLVDGYVDWFGASPSQSGSTPLGGLGVVVGAVGQYARSAFGESMSVRAAPDSGLSHDVDVLADKVQALPDRSVGAPPTPFEIFLVHGHDTAALHEVESFVNRTTGITPIVLMLEPSKGQTVIEKFEANAKRVGYAIVLMTADDFGGANGGTTAQRPRQNVVFEFGYFVAALGRSHVAALIPADVEKPSDVNGLVYIPFGPTSDWKEDLRREMRAATVPMI